MRRKKKSITSNETPTPCYQGKILRLDLTNHSISVEDLHYTLLREYIGGDGFAARWLYDELPPDCDPLGPQNKLIIATGPLTGTLWPTSGRFVMVSKSPLTGFWGESNAGGFFGPELKFAGFDAIIIEGRSEVPVFVEIENSSIAIRDARHLWGKDTRETILALCQDDPERQVLSIGPAGERLVRYATVMGNYHRAFGRTGMGAVWGSKNLKAIAVRGTGSIRVANFDRFTNLAKEAHRRIINDPQARQMFHYGTNLLVAYKQAIGEFVTRNHSEGIFEGAENLYAEVIRECFSGRPRACFGCTNACKMVYTTTPKNPWSPSLTTEGPEYEGTMAFGSNLAIADFDFILYVCDLCNKLGIDQISLGKVIGFLMECSENNLIGKDDTDGLDVRWGNKEAVLALVEKVVKRQGIGDILAEGVKRAAAVLGRGTERFAMHVKGLEISGQDGRAHRSVALTHAVSARGADHLRSLVTVDQLGYREAAIRRFGEHLLPEICNPYSEKHKAKAVKISEDVFAIRDSLVVCWYTCGWPPIFWIEDFAKILPPATGIEEFGNPDELIKIGERIVTLKRLFNLREGLRPEDDTLPARFLEEPLPEGPAAGQKVNLYVMLKEYYRLRGWNLKTGKISSKTLRRLGLKEQASINEVSQL